MPRRGGITPRQPEPDHMHNSRIVQQVINKVMQDGKKSTAERITYEALDILGKKTGKDPIEALEQSIKVLTPVLEVRSRRVGGATYQVPVEVPSRRGGATERQRFTPYWERDCLRSETPDASRVPRTTL